MIVSILQKYSPYNQSTLSVSANTFVLFISSFWQTDKDTQWIATLNA